MGNYGSGSTLQQFAVAASSGELSRMRALMERGGIDVNGCLPDGDFPLLMAASSGQLRACQYLLEHKADVNKQAEGGYSPLHVAAIQCNPATLEFLLGCGADIDLANHDGQTALMIASTHGDVKAVRALLLANAGVTRQDSDGNEVRMLLAQKAQQSPIDSKLVSLLALAGCDPTVTNDDGFCAAEVFEGVNLEALKHGLTLRIRRREDVLDTTLEQLLGDNVDENVLDTILQYDQAWPTPLGRRGSEEQRMTQLLNRPSKTQTDIEEFPSGNASVDVADGEVELDEMLPTKIGLSAPLLE